MAALLIKYAEAHDDAHKAGEKLLDLVESTHTDIAEIERLRKECDDAQQRINLLGGGLREEKDLKVMEEAVMARLAVEVSQCLEQAWNLEAEVARWRDEVRKLQADVDGKPLVFLCCPSL